MNEPELSRTQLIRAGHAIPRFLQGVYPFAGHGFFDLEPLSDNLRYVVPAGKTAEIIYFRAGNLSDDLLYLTISVNSHPFRYFPVGIKSDIHVALAIVESHRAGSVIEVGIAAPRGLTGTVVIDVGILEMDEAR